MEERWRSAGTTTSSRLRTPLHGVPRFRGKRIPVSIVLDSLAAGVTQKELHSNYPTLPPEAVPAALAYAAELARDRIVPVT